MATSGAIFVGIEGRLLAAVSTGRSLSSKILMYLNHHDLNQDVLTGIKVV